ncbi:hypothetical protein [Arthrobacter sp. H35-D1]|uniref:hypothetical protein n=1 Tax=Arthrobacter sp. H35-D1 TaxID=3046202 RepID=UPI0024BA1FE8|nr:hypothetical protein [Arthrobacter sp. H35-D1]MDJ0313003.1 hypothetical protein [Arthrobacter sp. H35-D1]
MITDLQWIALAACIACTAWRFPSLLKGRNRGLFWAFAMTSISVALSIPALYLPIDALLGGANLANVVLRLSLFAVFYLVSVKVAAAYSSPLPIKLIRGPIGLSVLTACSLGILITYFLSDVNGSSTGLSGFGGQASVAAFMWFGSVYPAYASACLVLPTAAAALSTRPAIDRAAAASLCVGFCLVVSTVPLRLLSAPDGFVLKLASFGSILFIAAGFAIVWVSFFRRPIPDAIRPP